MEDITLGTIVRFDQTSTVEYVYKNLDQDSPDKEIVKHKLKAPFEGMVVGKVKKATGQYQQGDYEDSARLVVDKFHDFYEVRTGLTNRPVMVHPDDVTVIDKSEVSIPNRNDLVFSSKPRVHSVGNGGGDFFDIEEVEDGLIKIESGSCCVYNHQGIYPTEYLTRLLEYAQMELTPEKIFKGWNKEYVQELLGKIKNE